MPEEALQVVEEAPPVVGETPATEAAGGAPDSAETSAPAAENIPVSGTTDSPPETQEGSAEGKPPPVETIKSLPVTIGEKTFDIPVTELVEGYKLAAQAKVDLEEAVGAQKAAREVMEGLVQNPFGTVMDALTGVFRGDKQKAFGQLLGMATELVEEHRKFQELPPAEQELITLRRAHAEAQEALKAQRARENADREQYIRGEETRKWLGEITGAIKTAGLPDEPALIKPVALEIYNARQRGEEISAAEGLKRFQKRLAGELEERLTVLDKGSNPEAILGLFPKLAEHLRKKTIGDVSRANSQRVTVPPNQRSARPGTQKPVVLRDGDWESYFRGK